MAMRYGNVAWCSFVSLSIARDSVAAGMAPPASASAPAPTRYRRERLIEEVKRYPVLYDNKHENHRDIDVRDRCWQEISDRLATHSEFLKREWKILRDSMRQALKRTSSTKNGEPAKKWRYQNQMAFVLPHLTIRRKREVARIKTDENEEQSEQEREEASKEPDWLESTMPGQSPEHEALELFFASVCQSAKRLPSKYQNSLKRQVLDALLRVEDEWERDSVSDQADTKHELSKFGD